jgi:acetoin utilization protein AcuB
VLNKDIITNTLPRLQLHDTIHRALHSMNDFHVTHLPVVLDDKLLGIISEDDLLDAPDETARLATLQEELLKIAVKEEEYFMSAVQMVLDAHLSVIPVVNTENELTGVITAADLLNQAGKYLGAGEPGGVIVLEMDKRDFSFGEISRLVETHDATITQLNTSSDPATGNLLVAIKINKVEISDIVAVLQRFEYNVRYYFGEELYENELRSNYENLMNYLDI